MSCGLNQQPFEMQPPGGGASAITLSNVGGGADLVNALSGGNYPIKTLLAGTNTNLVVGTNTITINSTGLTAGTSANNTIRWDGTNWVEDSFLQNDGTKVGVGALSTFGLFNSEGAHPNFTGRFWNTDAVGGAGIFRSQGTNDTLRVQQDGTGQGINIGMSGATGTDESIYILSNKLGGDHLTVRQNNGSGYEDMFRIMFTGEILSTAYKSTSPHAASYYSLYVDSATGLVYSQAAATGSITGASNVGTGDGWYKNETTGVLNFKSVLVANGLTKSAGTDEITISMPATSSTGILANNGGNWQASTILRVGTGGAGTGYVGIGTTPTTASHLSMLAATGKIVQFLQSFVDADILQLSKGGGSGNAINVDNYGTGTAVDIYSNIRTALSIQLGSTNTSPMISASKIGSGNFTVYGDGDIFTTGEASLGAGRALILNGATTIGGSVVSLFADAGVGMPYNLVFPPNQGGASTVLQNDGFGNLDWATISAGGLTYWTESEYTYSGQTGTKLIPNSVNTNQSVILSPKGTGFISAQQPDGTTAGGNNRGQYAVDLQRSRSASYMVASGNYSAIGGGQNNTVSGSHSTISGGIGNSISVSYVFIGGGELNQGNANWVFIGSGKSNAIYDSGKAVICGGELNVINSPTGFGNTGHSFIGGGYSNEINSDYSTIAGGNNSYIGSGTTNAIVGGETNSINGTGGYSFVGGGKSNSINATALHYNVIGGGTTNSIVESERCMILGGSNNQILVDADYSAIIGHNCIAEAGGKHSIIMGHGTKGKRYGERVMSNGALQSLGDNSFAEVLLLARTTSATPQEMFLGGVSGERFAISFNSTTLVKYRWVRRKLSDNTTVATHDFYVLVDKGATAASINIVAQWEDTCVTPKTGNDGSFVGGVDDIVVTADTTNGTLKFTATGQATTILWFVKAEVMEIIE